MDNKLISVIIPIYNRAEYLDKCIGSVLEQKDVNTEVILVDDGSTDASGQICDKYAAEHDNITAIHNTNHGVAHARNCGLDAAMGDYIFFLDSDDCIAPDGLINLKKALEDNNADYCVGKIVWYTVDGELYDEIKLTPAFSNKLIDEAKAWDIIIDVNSFLIVTVTGKLFRRSLWENLRLPEIPLSEDDYVLPALLSQCSGIYILDKVVYLQYLSPVSLVRNPPSYRILYSSGTILESVKYLISKGYYRVALFRFGDGTRRLIKYRQLLDSKEAKAEIKRQYLGYKAVSRQLAPHVNAKTKVRLALFRLNLSLYSFLRKLK